MSCTQGLYGSKSGTTVKNRLLSLGRCVRLMDSGRSSTRDSLRGMVGQLTDRPSHFDLSASGIVSSHQRFTLNLDSEA